jgi:hypothetical protein
MGDESGEQFLVLQKHGHHMRATVIGGSDVRYLSYDPDQNEPSDWSLSRLLLLRAGIQQPLSQSSLGDKDLLKVITATGHDAAYISVLGINVPVLWASSLFQVILALLAAWIVGPLRVLKETTNYSDVDHTWVFL